MSREVVTRLYCHNDLISLVMLDRQRKPLMRTNVRRRESWEWSDHTLLGVYPPPPYLPMQGPLGFPCLVVEPFDGGDGTRPAQRSTVRTVGDLPDATLTVLPEAIAVGRGCVAP